jgi:hypothetical protein
LIRFKSRRIAQNKERNTFLRKNTVFLRICWIPAGIAVTTTAPGKTGLFFDYGGRGRKSG